MKYEYRIVVKRVGVPEKNVKRGTLAGVRRRLVLLGPEPWRAYTDRDPDELDCCNGEMCGCGGLTIREKSNEFRKDLPPIEYIQVKRRTVSVGDWENIGISTPRGNSIEQGE